MIEILIVLVIVGVILWFVNTYVPMAAPFKTAVNVVAVILLLLYLLRAFGIWHGGPAL